MGVLQDMSQAGLDWNAPTQEFLAQMALLSGNDVTAIGQTIFTNYPVMDVPQQEEMIKRVGKDIATRLKYNKTNKLQSIEKIDVTGDTLEAKMDTQMYKDAAGGRLFPTENVTGGTGYTMDPLAGGCMNAFFHPTGASVATTLDAAAQMFEAMAQRMRFFASEAQMHLILESKTGETGVSAPMRGVMNQAKMCTETMALASTSYTGGMFLPKTAATFMVNRNMPATSAKFQKFYAALERITQRMNREDLTGLSDEEALKKIELTDKEEDDLNEDTDNVWGELRRAGLAMAMAKQFRGGSGKKIVKEHEHYKFLMASLRAQAWNFAIAAPLQVARRCGADRWLMSQNMVAMERLMHCSATTTAMLTIQDTNVSLMKLFPAAPFQPYSFTLNQEDNGGEAVLVTTRTVLRHEKGLPLGCEEAMEALNAPDAVSAIQQLTEQALQGSYGEDTEMQRLAEKTAETQRAKAAQDSEAVEFVREGIVLRIVEKGTPGTPRRLVKQHHTVTPFLHQRAPPAVGGVVTPQNEGVDYSWMAAGGSAETLPMQENAGQEDDAPTQEIGAGAGARMTLAERLEAAAEEEEEEKLPLKRGREVEKTAIARKTAVTRSAKSTQMLADAMSNKPVLNVGSWQPRGAVVNKRAKVVFTEEELEEMRPTEIVAKELPLQTLANAAAFTMAMDWNKGDNMTRNISAFSRLKSLGLKFSTERLAAPSANLAAGF